MNKLDMAKRVSQLMAYAALVSLFVWIIVTIVGLNRFKGPTPLEGFIIQFGILAWIFVFPVLAVIAAIAGYIMERSTNKASQSNSAEPVGKRLAGGTK